MTLHALDDAAWTSPWRGLSCSAKVFSALSLVICALAVPGPGSLVVAIASVVHITVWARIPWRTLVIAIALPLTSILIGAATIAVVVGDAHAVGHLGPFSVSRGSLLRGLDVLEHALAGTLAIFTLALTTPMADLLGWLRRFRIPGPLLDLAGLMYRLLFVTAASADALIAAGHRRHSDAPGVPLRRRWDNVGLLTLAVGTRAAVRATRMERGLDLRGDLDTLQTLPHPQRPAPGLIAATIAVVAAAAATGVVFA